MCSLSWYSSCPPQHNVCVQCQEVRTCVRQCFGQSSTIGGFTYIKTGLAYINSVRLFCHNVQVMFEIRTKAPQNIWKHVWQNIKLWGFCLTHIQLLMREWKERVWNIFMFTYFSQWKSEYEEIFLGWTVSMVLFFFLTLLSYSIPYFVCSKGELTPLGWIY